MEYKICLDCFKNKWLKRYVVEHGEIDKCTKCGCTDKKVISLDDKKFQNLFKGVFRYYYSETLYNSHWGGFSNWIELLDKENEIFNFEFSEESDEDLFYTLDKFQGYVNNFDEEVSLYYGYNRMDAFVQPIKDKQWGWLRELSDFTESNNPHKVVKEISDKVGVMIKKLESNISNVTLYRARIGIDTTLIKPDILEEDMHKVTIPYKNKKIGAPKPKITGEGRFNRAGTSYLYLASEKKTAINEIRPSVGHEVSIGQFKINKEVNIIDFTKLDFYDYGFSNNKIKEYIKLANLEKTISIPNPDKQYTNTQCLADTFLLLGYDGIKFNSSVVDATYNIVLFDKNNADYVDDSHQAIHIKGLEYDYDYHNTKIDERYLEDYIDFNNHGNEANVIAENFGINLKGEKISKKDDEYTMLFDDFENFGVE